MSSLKLISWLCFSTDSAQIWRADGPGSNVLEFCEILRGFLDFDLFPDSQSSLADMILFLIVLHHYGIFWLHFCLFGKHCVSICEYSENLMWISPILVLCSDVRSLRICEGCLLPGDMRIEAVVAGVYSTLPIKWKFDKMEISQKDTKPQICKKLKFVSAETWFLHLFV